MVIRPVNIKSETDIQAISKIWRNCFTDDQSYIDSYISNCLPHTSSWVLLCDNMPVSILSMLPSYALLPLNQSISPGKIPPSDHFITLRGAYIYGVATLPEYRGSSYSRMLLNKAMDYSKAMGFDYTIVKPADELLFEFYQRTGFDITLYSNKNIFHVDSSINTLDLEMSCNHFSLLTPEQLFILREQYNSTTSFLWPPEILRYALIETLSRSGIAATNGQLYLIAYPTKAGNINLLETNAQNSTQFNLILNYLLKLFPDAATITIDSANINKIAQHRCALLKILNPDPNIAEALSSRYLSLPME